MRNQQRTNRRNKTPADTNGWYFHPTKGWKRTFWRQRKIEQILNSLAVERIKEKFGFDLEGKQNEASCN